MTDDIYWIKIVLRKLYKLHLKDVNPLGYWWACEWDDYLSKDENLENCNDEIKALNALSNAGVVDLGMMDNDLTERHPERVASLSNVAKYLDHIPIITDFSNEQFSKYCSMISFNPSVDELLATLSLDSIVPVVNANGQTFRLNPLKDGSSVFKVIEYCFKKQGTVRLEEIRPISQNITNINQLLKSGPFDKDTGPLACFIETTPKTIKLLSAVNLSQAQFNLIKSKSN